MGKPQGPWRYLQFLYLAKGRYVQSGYREVGNADDSFGSRKRNIHEL